MSSADSVEKIDQLGAQADAHARGIAASNEQQCWSDSAATTEYVRGENVRGNELMPYDDGSLSADKAQSSAMTILLNYTDPSLAAGAAVFGLGLVVLPLLARVSLCNRKDDQIDNETMFSYDPHSGKNSRQQSLRVFQGAELKGRLGPVDAAYLLREITMTTDEVDDHINSCDMDTTDSETSLIQKWRDKANANLKSLQKRSALAFLGLPPDSSEADVGKMYKKMALELHPDKGGDPEKFQELQEMKERLNEADDDEKQDEDDEEVRKAKERERGDDEETKKLPPDERIKKLRMDAHDHAVRVWDRAQKAKNEIIGEKSIKSNPQPALNMMRTFVERFVNSEVKPLRHGDTKGAEAKFKKFLQQGAEIIAIAAVSDVQTTLSTVAMHFNYRIAARSGSAEIKNKCDLLLEAIADVPVRSEEFLKELQDALAAGRESEKKAKEDRAAMQREREAKGDYSGDTASASAAPAAPSTTPASKAPPPASAGTGAPHNQSVAQGKNIESEAGAPKAKVDPFADFDFEPESRSKNSEACTGEKQSKLVTIAKQTESAVTITQEKRTCWDPSFDHPYAGALKSNGTGIYCRPCQRWINTYEYNVEVFFTHVDRVHPKPPPGWKG